MKEISELLNSFATRIADYRAGELPSPSPDHVERWLRQFPKNIQLPLLRELAHVLGVTYFTRSFVEIFLDRLILNRNLTGDNPCEFWRRTALLDIQQNGNSQKEMLALFARSLLRQCGFSVAPRREATDQYVYLDDVLFTGSRIGSDLVRWIAEDAPSRATVDIIVIATHSLGEWQCKERLAKEAQAQGKMIQVRFWKAISFENRKKYRDSSEVLWPAILPVDDQLQRYMGQESRFPFEARAVGGRPRNEIFSSEQGRQLLEQELLRAGMRIRSYSRNPSSAMRPLGFSGFGLGFGSTIVTFRNCPPNCPLALWWGDPEADTSSPLSRWYPLFPRKTYG